MRHANGFAKYKQEDSLHNHKAIANFFENGKWHCWCGYPVIALRAIAKGRKPICSMPETVVSRKVGGLTQQEAQ